MGDILILKETTPKAWLTRCEANLQVLLSDHAHCERKAAASALSLVSRVPQDARLVRAMAALARQECSHLSRVARALRQRGWDLLPDGKDPYVLALRAHIAKGKSEQLLDELLVCALIEQRSAQRLEILAQGLSAADLKTMYTALAQSEKGHAQLFVDLARFHFPNEMPGRLEVWLGWESQAMLGVEPSARMHG